MVQPFSALSRGRVLLLLGWLGLVSTSALGQTLPLRGYLTAHDPSTITQCKNRYYIFWTGQGILSKSSADKVFWTPGPPVFSNAPAWTTNLVPGFTGLFWAPDLLYFNGTYHLYYAVSTFGSQVSAIGLVTNPTLDPTDPSYLWTDQGPVINSTNGSPYNTIDPSFSWDNSGKLWMAFGSYWNGIYLVQLNSTTGLRISSNSPTYQLAYNSSIEASYLWRRGGYYYLFANWGSCCSGVNSTYNIRVGRSTSITGPYLDQNGVSMAGNGGSLFLQANGKYTGPGHVGIFSTNGVQWFSHHYYDANSWAPQYDAYGSPDFSYVPLSWTSDDWPYYTNDWSALYNFQADARDDNGQYYGLLQNGASVIPDPTYGHVLNLNGTNQYVWLPPGVGYGQTFVAVVKWRGGGPWQRIFDFGFDTTRTVMMTAASSDNVLRCDINPGGLNGQSDVVQTIQWTNPLPTGVWTHVALTLNGSQGVLYVNGAPVVTTNITYLPLNVAPQTNHLGRSKFSADPYFNGEYASFRVYGRVLSPEEIAAPLPVIAQPINGSSYWPGSTISFNGAATDFASRPLAASNLTWEIEYAQDGQTNLVSGPFVGTNGSFTIPATADSQGNYLFVLTAIDNSNRQSSVCSVIVPANPPTGWSSYYPLKANANDANGHYNGTLNGGASFVSDPTRGSVLNLNGTSQYVSFPPGLAGMQTFMAWVYWNGGGAWQRIYDFGDDTNRYSVLTPLASSGDLRFNISIDSIPGEQIVDAPTELPIGVWTHVAVVMNGVSAVLYVNGTQVASNLFANLVPLNLHATNNYFGKSQWPADPYFNGQLSSVRIFSYPLSASQIVAPQISISEPVQGAVYNPGAVIPFAGSANDFYDNPISSTGLTWTVSFINGGATNVVFGPASGSSTGVFDIPTGGAGASNGFYQVSLRAVDTLGRAATNSVNVYPAAASVSANWASFYPFTSGAQDASNIYNGTLKNGAYITNDPVRGNVLFLSGSSLTPPYVNLPPGASAAQTLSGWVKWNGGASWQRIFDFNQNNNDFFYLTTSDQSNLLQCAITPDLAVYNQIIESPVPLHTNTWTQVAVVMDGRQGILYLNGTAVAVNNSVNLLPSDLSPTNCNFGKSAFQTDPYFAGELSDVRLNSAPLSLSDLVAPLPAITLPTNGSLFAGGERVGYAGTATDYTGAPLSPSAFTWSGQFFSNGVSYNAFGPASGVTNGNWLVPTNLTTTTNVFYRLYLTVADTNGNQQTVSGDVHPQTSQLNFATVPTGLELSLDGQPLTVPSLAAVVGTARLLGAPSPQTQNGTNYQFVIWSDGGAASHDILVPPTNATFTASFLPPELGLQLSGRTLQLTWPEWASAMTLYSTLSLKPAPVWSPVTNAAAVSNGLMTLELPATNRAQFFRLELP